MKYEVNTNVKKADKKGNVMNGVISKVITKSTGYVEVTWENGGKSKEMAFNLTDMEGNALKSNPAASSKSIDPVKKMQRELLSFAATKRTEAGFEVFFNTLAKFLQKMQNTEGFASQIAKTVENSMNPYSFCVARLSDKQALFLAQDAVKNNIDL